MFNLPHNSHLEAHMATDVARLIDRFEKDIMYDLHGTLIKVGRSAAARALIALADGSTFAAIADHLKKNPPSNKGIYTDLPLAWCLLLHDIGLTLKIQTPPADWKDLQGWIDWITQNIATTPAA
ncbi:MAG: hypothetical protein ACYC44_02685 [Patescibacteria group bacterium]